MVVFCATASRCVADSERQARQAHDPNDFSVFVRALPPTQDAAAFTQRPARFNAQFGQPAQPQFSPYQLRHFPQQPQQRTFNNNGGQQFTFQDALQGAFTFPQQQPSPATTTQASSAAVPPHSQSVSVSSSPPGDPFRHGKVVGSVQPPPPQVIQKSPASEIPSEKSVEAKDKAAGTKDKDKDEYVVYYYYYYDDENKKGNQSLNFDDVPNLEGFDRTAAGGAKVKVNKTPNPQNRFEPKTVTGVPPTGQQQAPSAQEPGVTSAPQTVTQVSFSMSVSEGPRHPPVQGQSFNIRTPLSGPPNLDFTGAKLAPGPPPSAVPFESRANVGPSVSSTATTGAQEGTNEITNKKAPEQAETTTTSTTSTTTEPPTTVPPATTTEEPTTTQKSRRPFGNRRRFGGHANRPPTGRRPSTTTSSTTPPSRRPIGGARRNRPHLRPNRLQFGRRPPAGRPQNEENSEEETTEDHATTTIASTTTTKKRFGGGRFGSKTPSSRSRAASSTTTTTTTAAPRRGAGAHAPPRPSGGLFGRSRGPRPRPPFLRNRPGARKPADEEEKADESEGTAPVTTQASKEDRTEPPVVKQHQDAEEDTDVPEDQVEATEPSPAPTPENKPSRSRFGSRPRPPLFGGRPRPNVLGR